MMAGNLMVTPRDRCTVTGSLTPGWYRSGLNCNGLCRQGSQAPGAESKSNLERSPRRVNVGRAV